MWPYPKAWICGRSLAGIAGSNPAGGMSVCCECYVLSGRGLCDGLITSPEESYRVWCVWVWSGFLDDEEALAQWGLLRHGRGGGIERTPSFPISSSFAHLSPVLITLCDAYQFLSFSGRAFLTCPEKLHRSDNQQHIESWKRTTLMQLCYKFCVLETELFSERGA